MADMTFNANLIPKNNGTLKLGDSNKRWKINGGGSASEFLCGDGTWVIPYFISGTGEHSARMNIGESVEDENIASGNVSFAIGSANKVSGTGSFVGGLQMSNGERQNDVSGSASLGFGSGNHVKANYAQGFGVNTTVETNCTASTTFGRETIAAARTQFVIGQFNSADVIDDLHGNNTGKYLFIIGNGNSENARSNAFTVDWDGNIEVPGKIKINGKTVSETIHYIEGSSTDTTAGTWTGTDENITAYYNGLTIIYVPAIAGASTTTLNINGLGAKTCYYTGTSKLTTQYPAGTPILLTYKDNYWRRADYNSNTNTLQRTYRSSTNVELPIAGISTANSATAAYSAIASGSYKDIYAAIPETDANRVMLNPSTGLVTFGQNGLKTNKIQVPKTSNGTTYGVGSAGQALMSNGNTVYWGNHTHSEIVTTGDNRSVETKPNDYSNKIIFQGIKAKATIGTPSSDTYSYVVGLRGWSDSSGGNSHELAFNNTGLQIRNGATTAWNAWRHITTADLTGVGASNNPVYVASDGKITASSYTIKTSVPENAVFTDAKVKQTAVTASDYSNWRSLVWGAANSATEGFSPTTLTDQVYTTSSLSVQPSTGTIKATTFKGTATVASTVAITDTARTSAATYYPIFVDNKTDNQTLRASSRFYYYDYGVAASGGWLNVGTSNFKGGITLHDNSSYYGSMAPTTLTANRSYTLPDKSGTIALTSDLTTTVSNAWSDGATAGPKISTTVNGVTSDAISIPSASSTKSGIVTTAAQTFAGDKNLIGITTLNNAFRVQKVEIIKAQETDQSAGWYRTCVVKSLYNYANFKVLLTGGWVNGAPTLATLDIHMRNGLASIVIEHRGFATSRITKVRLAKVEGTTNNAYFDIFLPATSGASAALYATFYGNIIISDIATENTITTSTTDIIASVDIETYGYYNNTRGYFSKLIAGDGLVKAVSSNNCEISLDATASGGNHGIWSNGYYNGSAFQSDGKWVVYRDQSGNIYLNGRANTALADGDGNTITSTYVKKAGDTMTGNLTVSKSNHSNDTGFIALNTDSTNPLRIGYIIGVSGNGGIYDYTHEAWKLKITPDGTATFTGTATAATKATQDGSGNVITSTYVKKAGDTMTGNLIIEKTGDTYVEAKNTETGCRIEIDVNSAGKHGLWSSGYYANSTYTASSKWIYYRGTDGEAHSDVKIYGAVWNDYAEMRNVPEAQKENSNLKPGMCVHEIGDGTMTMSINRLERGCKIISDTFGFNIGETEECKTPIAVSGRVLVYINEGREIASSHIGWPVCSGPNGTVSIMTEEEEEKYPSRIIGTISEIPNYDEWGTENVKIDGRIWIYVR